MTDDGFRLDEDAFHRFRAKLTDEQLINSRDETITRLFAIAKRADELSHSDPAPDVWEGESQRLHREARILCPLLCAVHETADPDVITGPLVIVPDRWEPGA